MKEILFRAKATNRNPNWDYRTNYKNDDWVYGLFTKKYDEMFPNLPAQFTNEDGVACIDVDHETVGQWTGLTDMNGVKIFEGDILQGEQYPFKSLDNSDYNYFAEVIWFENSPAFGIYTFKNPTSKVSGISTGNCEYMEDWDSNDWKVIGNIHDNPELTEVIYDTLYSGDEEC